MDEIQLQFKVNGTIRSSIISVPNTYKELEDEIRKQVKRLLRFAFKLAACGFKTYVLRFKTYVCRFKTYVCRFKTYGFAT